MRNLPKYFLTGFLLTFPSCIVYQGHYIHDIKTYNFSYKDFKKKTLYIPPLINTSGEHRLEGSDLILEKYL